MILFWFVVFVCFGLILVVYWLFCCDNFDVGRVHFAPEWSKEGLVGLFVSIEFIPPALVTYDREGLHSFFLEDEAVIAILVSWVFAWYYLNVGVGQAQGSIVEVCRVNVHPFTCRRASCDVRRSRV